MVVSLFGLQCQPSRKFTTFNFQIIVHVLTTSHYKNRTGLSANRYAPGSINPRTAPPKPFENNVAHASGNALHIDDMEKPDGTTELAGYYVPSGYFEALYTNFVAYKNRGYGVW